MRGTPGGQQSPIATSVSIAVEAARSAAEEPSINGITRIWKREHDVSLAELWSDRHIPPGSVISFPVLGEEATDAGTGAVLVTGMLSESTGIWLTVQILGGVREDGKKELRFRSSSREGERRFTSATPTQKGIAALQKNQGYIYIGSRGNPPGDFAAVWLTPAAKKKVASGPQLERQAAEAQLAEPDGRSAPSLRWILVIRSPSIARSLPGAVRSSLRWRSSTFGKKRTT